MGLYHTSYTTATLVKPSHLNVPFGTLDKAITYTKVLINCESSLVWDSTAGSLTWSEPIRIVAMDESDGKMFTNYISSGTMTLTTGSIAYVDITTVDNSTVNATFVAFSTGSTALISSSRIILGMVNTSKLEFYPVNLFPSFSEILNTTAAVHSQQHAIDSTADHTGTVVEDNVIVGSSEGLFKDSGIAISAIATHSKLHAIDSTANHSSTATENNVLVGSSEGLPKDCGKAYTEFTTHTQQHAIDSTADHTGTLTENLIIIGSSVGLIKESTVTIANFTTHAQEHSINSSADHTSTASASAILIGSATGLPIDSGRQLSEFQGARETTVDSSAVTNINFTSYETYVVNLIGDSSIEVTGGVSGGVYRIKFNQDGTGGREITWSSAVQNIMWRGGAAATVTTASNSIDIVTILKSNSSYYGDISNNFG